MFCACALLQASDIRRNVWQTEIYRAQCGVSQWYTNMAARNKQCKHLEPTLPIYRPLIIRTDKTSIYISTFPNGPAFKRALGHAPP